MQGLGIILLLITFIVIGGFALYSDWKEKNKVK